MLYKMLTIIIKGILKIIYKVEVRGIENEPRDIGLIVCSNHYHWLDPVVVACFINRQVSFMAKKELFKNKLFGLFLRGIYAFPVNRGKADISAIKTSLNIVKSNRVLGIFPEGTRVKKGEDPKVEPGIAMIGIRGKAKILPIGINCNYKFRSKLFINIGQAISLEKYYGEKLNIKDFENISKNIMKEVEKLKVYSE